MLGMKRAFARIKKTYRNFSVPQKLFAAFSVLIAVPAIIVSFLFIRTQETQLYRDAMATGRSHAARLSVQLRSRMDMIETMGSTALKQKSFLDFIHSDMQADGLQLVKFRQNQFEQMQSIIKSNEMIAQLSFYVDNPNLHEIWPEIYHYDRFTPRDYWAQLRDAGGTAFKLFALNDGEHTLAYYRLVRLQGQGRRYPSIMEIRATHNALLGDLITQESSGFFTTILDGQDAQKRIVNPGHPMAKADVLDEVLTSVHQQLNVMDQQEPIKIQADGQTYYALYRYIAPLDAYVVDIASHQVLMQGPRSWYAAVVAITLCVLLLMMLMVSEVTRRTFRRLDSVLAAMRRVRKGQLDAKIDIDLGEGQAGDEIDEVAISYNKMLDEVNRLMTQVVDKQLIAKNAQLHSLQSQINSHFLYNALESIRMLAEVEGQSAIADALVSLGTLMRYSMRWRSDSVAVREELANIQSYIHFINFMQGGSFTLTAQLPWQVLDYQIPKMCMQPVVENVVHHAAPSGTGVEIQISAQVEGDSLTITVEDNGAGIAPERLAHIHAVLKGESDLPVATNKTGLGLENVHKRLQLHYGQSFGLWVESTQHQRTLVTIRLPWEHVNLGGW